jgi:hypothetical protein
MLASGMQLQAEYTARGSAPRLGLRSSGGARHLSNRMLADTSSLGQSVVPTRRKRPNSISAVASTTDVPKRALS